jgi:hypothetical protein
MIGRGIGLHTRLFDTTMCRLGHGTPRARPSQGGATLAQKCEAERCGGIVTHPSFVTHRYLAPEPSNDLKDLTARRESLKNLNHTLKNHQGGSRGGRWIPPPLHRTLGRFLYPHIRRTSVLCSIDVGSPPRGVCCGLRCSLWSLACYSVIIQRATIMTHHLSVPP